MNDLIQSIYDNPGDWHVSRHTFDHSGGFRLWVANGFAFCAPEDSALRMSFFEKRRIWKAFKWWCTNAPLEAAK